MVLFIIFLIVVIIGLAACFHFYIAGAEEELSKQKGKEYTRGVQEGTQKGHGKPIPFLRFVGAGDTVFITDVLKLASGDLLIRCNNGDKHGGDAMLCVIPDGQPHEWANQERDIGIELEDQSDTLGPSKGIFMVHLRQETILSGSGTGKTKTTIWFVKVREQSKGVSVPPPERQ